MIDFLTVGLFVVGAVWIFVVLRAYRKELRSKASQAISKLSELSEPARAYELSESTIEYHPGQRMAYAEPALLVFAVAILVFVGVRAYSVDTPVDTGKVEAKFASGYVVGYQDVDKNAFDSALSKIKERPERVSYLRLEDVNVSDLRGLAHLQDLESLNLDGTLVENLQPLRGLHGLRALDLGRTPFYDTVQLSYFPNLEWLDLSGTKVYDFDALKNLVNLQHLELRDLEIEDLSPLSELKNLKRLDISETNVADLGPLRKLTQLEELKLASTKVQDLEPLYDSSSLRTLDLSETSVDPDQVERLRQRLAEAGNTGLEVRVSPGWGAAEGKPAS